MELFLLMKKKKLRMRDVAEMVGVSIPTLSKIINKVRSPNLRTAAKLKVLFGDDLSIMELMSEQDWKGVFQFKEFHETDKEIKKMMANKTREI